MGKATLYFGARAPPEGARKTEYCFYHELNKAGGMALTGSDPSLERLAGYLEGATAGRWDSIQLNNGIPQRYWKCFDNEEIHPLSNEKLKKLMQNTDLLQYYPHLVE